MIELNDKDVNFYRLEESGNYSEDLLTQLRRGNHIVLRDLDLKLRANKKFMEPLLYAYRELHGKYIIYQYLGEHLQEDPSIATDVVLEQPEIIKDTLVSDNPEFILDMAEINPRVILYMADSLKSNEEFKERLSSEISDDRVDDYIKIIENTNEPEFMKEAIKKDPSLIAQASEELKNNKDFMQEVCRENKEVINYVSGHTEEFGKEGLNAAKGVLVENTTAKSIEEFEEELKRVQDEKADMESQEGFDDKDERYKKVIIRERQLRNSIKFIEKIKNGEVKQERAIRLINAICDNLGEEYRTELLKYVKMDDAVIQRQNEEKGISPENIEKKAETIPLSEIAAEPIAIRKQVEKEKDLMNGEKNGVDLGISGELGEE